MSFSVLKIGAKFKFWNLFQFSHLLILQRKLGKDAFPLIEQSYTLGCDQLTSAAPVKYPVVVKVGQGVKGVGKVLTIDQMHEFIWR